MNSVILSANGVPVTTSWAIAVGTDTDHASVIKLVRTYQDDLVEFGWVGFEIQPFETAGGTQQREVAILNEQQATLLITYMRNSDIVRAFKKRLVKDFWAMRQPAAPAALSTMDILTLAMESEKGRLLAIEQRDHAIATKAQIGDKKTATAMATASRLKRENNKLKDELGFNTHHATVIAVEGASGKKFGKQDWRPLKAWCKANGASSVTVPCARYGKAQAWPAGAWGAVYGVDLVELFGEVAA